MADGNLGIPPDAPRATRRSGRIGRPPVHGLKTLRRAVTQLTTRRLDGRSAVAVRRWKEDVRRDRGGPSDSDSECDRQVIRRRIARRSPGDFLACYVTRAARTCY